MFYCIVLCHSPLNHIVMMCYHSEIPLLMRWSCLIVSCLHIHMMKSLSCSRLSSYKLSSSQFFYSRGINPVWFVPDVQLMLTSQSLLRPGCSLLLWDWTFQLSLVRVHHSLSPRHDIIPLLHRCLLFIYLYPCSFSMYPSTICHSHPNPSLRVPHAPRSECAIDYWYRY